MGIVAQMVNRMRGLSEPRRKFMITLLMTMFVTRGKLTYTNLSRYSGYSERTIRRQSGKEFEFVKLNQEIVAEGYRKREGRKIAAIDASFIPKSGKKTEGLDRFWNGSAGRAEKGLELTTLCVVEVETKLAFAVAAEATPAGLTAEKAKVKKDQAGKSKKKVKENGTADTKEEPTASQPQPKPRGRKSKLKAEPTPAEVVKAIIQTPSDAGLPSPTPPAATPVETGKETTRVDWYAAFAVKQHPNLPLDVTYLTGDGYFAKYKFVVAVRATGLHLISKLHASPNLRYVNTKPYPGYGRPAKYDGKVSFSDLSRFDHVAELEPGLDLYTQVVYWMTYPDHQVRVALLVDRRTPGKIGHVVLFSTDVDLPALDILHFYQARFQIEFLFRDAKQFTGLTHCQSRTSDRLTFHFNASLSALNLAKLDCWLAHDPSSPFVFSLDDYKRKAFNHFWLNLIFSNLDLDPELLKTHPNFDALQQFGLIAA